jgi:uncharacterized protein (TIGR00369 family)
MQQVMDQAALADFLAAEFPQVADDFIIQALGQGCLTLGLRVRDGHLRPGGTVSGPAMFALADVAAYLVILAHIGPMALAVTTSSHMDFMRKPPAGADLRCEMRLLKLGRALAVADGLIFSAGEVAPVARAALTYAVPRS